MNRDDIIRMARENGIVAFGGAVLKLCALVAAAEKQKVVEYMNSRAFATGHGDTVEDLLKELEWQVAEREREACAKLCDHVPGLSIDGAKRAAAAIRARGEQGETR